MANWQEIDTYAKIWVKEAGEKIRDSFLQTLNVQTKTNPNDLVTNIDKATEQFFINRIKEKYPSHNVFGEEGLGDQIDDLNGIVWIIDPIDGTINFVHQQRNFAISIGIYENGVGVIGLIYDVVHDELYHAIKGEGAFLNGNRIPKLSPVELKEAIIGINAAWVADTRGITPPLLSSLVLDVRGTRSYGSAAIEIAHVVAGRLDAYITMRLSPWDIAAGRVLIEEVGGIATTLRGAKLNMLQQNTIFFSKPELHQTIMKNYLKAGDW